MKYTKLIRVTSEKVGMGTAHPSYPNSSYLRTYTASDFKYDLQDVSDQYPDCSFYINNGPERSGSISVDNSDKYKDVDKLDISKIKTYMFIKGTKFNRDYFKRLMGHAQKVILPKKAQIILYDDDSINKYICSPVKSYYCAVEDKKDNTIYYCTYSGNDGISYFTGPNNNLEMGYGDIYAIKNSKLSLLSGKLIHIEDFLKTVNGLPMLDKLTMEDLKSIFKQSVSEDEKVRNTALNTVSSYSEKYYLIKFLCFYCANINSTLKVSSKADFYKKQFSGFFLRDSAWGKYKYDAFEHISQIIQVSEQFVKHNNDYDTQLLVDFLNTDVFGEFIKFNKYPMINVKFEVKNVFGPSKSQDEPQKSEEVVDIEEFAV